MIAGITAFVDAAFDRSDRRPPWRTSRRRRSPTAPRPITSTGPLGDLVAIANAMTAANMPIQNLTYIMSPSNAYVLALQKNANGIALFPR